MRALVADDHELFRTGIRQLLERRFAATLVVEAGSLTEAVQKRAEIIPADLLVFDLNMPGVQDVDSIAALRDTFSAGKIVIMSASEGRAEVGGALAAGIDGYVPKSLGFAETAEALERVLSGHIYVPRLPLRGAPEKPSATSTMAMLSQELTERQQQVLEELVTGKSSKQIARALDIAEGTVKVHLAAIFRLLDVNSRSEAIARVRDAGWLPRQRN